MSVVGAAGRLGDGLVVRLVAGPRRGLYRVSAAETPALLEGRAGAALRAGDAAVGAIAPSRDLRVLRGSFAARGFVEWGPGVPTATAFLVPRTHLAAHYARFDGPVAVIGAGPAGRSAP